MNEYGPTQNQAKPRVKVQCGKQSTRPFTNSALFMLTQPRLCYVRLGWVRLGWVRWYYFALTPGVRITVRYLLIGQTLCVFSCAFNFFFFFFF